MAKMFYSLGAFKMALTLARLIPRSLAHAIAPVIGRIGYWQNDAGRAALRVNLARVTKKAGSAFDALCASNVSHFSRMMADYFLCASEHGRARELLEEWRGIENLEQALALGKGVILVTAHLGNWEMGATLLALRGMPMSIITLEEPTNELTRWREERRRQLGIKTITVGPGHDFAFVEMIQALRRNEILAMLVDRPYEGTGTPVELFGGKTDFSTGPALLWQYTGSPVVPAFVLQNPRGRYVSFADPIIPLEGGADARTALQANTQRIATYFETVIRDHPEQWFNYVPIWNA
ncbi:MAG: lysophospholipid acyltransferase family protein [Verrucomicrobiota bacterium]